MHEQLARELIRAWRGRRSQRGWSRRLGYASNVANGWESGRRWPTAAVALAVAGRSGVDVDAALRRFLHAAPPAGDAASPDAVAALLRHLRGRTPIRDLAARSGRSRFAVSRWLSGRAEPRLPELLAVVDAATGRAAELAAALAGARSLPSLRATRETVAARMGLVLRDPWSQAVIAALCLHSYGETAVHADAWVAERLGVDVPTVSAAIATLAAAGQIRWDGAHWEATPIFSQDTAGDPAELRRFKEHWAAEGRRRLPGRAGDLFSTNFFTASAADHARLRELHVAYFVAVRDVIASSTGPLDRVLVVNTQLFDLAAEDP